MSCVVESRPVFGDDVPVAVACGDPEVEVLLVIAGAVTVPEVEDEVLLVAVEVNDTGLGVGLTGPVGVRLAEFGEQNA